MNNAEYGIMRSLEDTHWWYAGLHELVMACLEREYAIHGTLAILDAGCGTGRLCQLMARYGRVTGCDYAETALEFCRRRGLENVVLADLNTFDPGADRYDVITSMDVLYHRAVEDDRAVIRSLYRALKPGGALILNLPAHEGLRGLHDRAVHTRHRYRRGEVSALLAAAGFRVEKSTYRLAALFPPILAIRCAGRIAMRGDCTRVTSDLTPPPPWLNRILLRYLRLENRWIARHSLPIGTSVFAVARKAGASGAAPRS